MFLEGGGGGGGWWDFSRRKYTRFLFHRFSIDSTSSLSSMAYFIN